MTTGVSGVLIGLGATLIMDLWNVFLRHAFDIRSLDYCLLGRWVRHMPREFRQASIASAPRQSNECGAGWVAHYSIGVSLGVVFSLAVPEAWLTTPTLPPALAYGVATVVLPFVVLQPALGLGVASARAQRPTVARIKSLATHAVFGCGLYISAALLVA